MVRAVEIAIIEYRLISGRESEFDGIKYGGLANITRSDQAIHIRRGRPPKRTNSPEVLNFDAPDLHAQATD
jgi:hypothetical protein